MTDMALPPQHVPNLRLLDRSKRFERLVEVYRSGSWSWADAANAADLVETRGISYLVDLRSETERRRDPPAPVFRALGVIIVNRPISDYPQEAIAPAVPTSKDYVRYYLDMIVSARTQLAAAVQALDARPGVPRAFFCHAGKDRTGVLAAVLLDREGASEDEIVTDFAASGPSIAASIDLFKANWERRGMSRPSYLSRMHVDADNMRCVLRQMRQRHGGLAAYVLGKA
jgi:protein-tyrosine phosphatase